VVVVFFFVVLWGVELDFDVDVFFFVVECLAVDFFFVPDVLLVVVLWGGVFVCAASAADVTANAAMSATSSSFIRTMQILRRVR
jgi:hypothetical protein